VIKKLKKDFDPRQYTIDISRSWLQTLSSDTQQIFVQPGVVKEEEEEEKKEPAIEIIN